ncbi:MAG: hypothetical protein ACI9ZT_000682 [Gammaproteobacteria bacterium]|jgi:hypothetical protein
MEVYGYVGRGFTPCCLSMSHTRNVYGSTSHAHYDYGSLSHIYY